MRERHLPRPLGSAIDVDPCKNWELLHLAVLIMESQICDCHSILFVKARSVQQMHAAEALIYADSLYRLGQWSSAVHDQVTPRKLNNSANIELGPVVDLEPLRQTGEIIGARADVARFREQRIVVRGQIEQRCSGAAIACRNLVARLAFFKTELLRVLFAKPLPAIGQHQSLQRRERLSAIDAVTGKHPCQRLQVRRRPAVRR